MLAVLALSAVASIALPGGPPVGMDYVAYDPAHRRVWVPAGNTGRVDVIETATNKLTPIDGFVTRASTKQGRPAMGPSSVTLGEGTAWIGSRGDDSLCAFDAKTLARRSCTKLPSMPDGIAYVGVTREVWITTPAHDSLTIVDVQGELVQAEVKLPGAPEGYAIDEQHGVFYTNLEDKDQTLAIDVRSRKVVSVWPAGCGADGPRGLALDVERHLLLVACTDGVRSRDLAHGGKLLGRLATGKGVDEIAYRSGTLYIASSEDGVLTVANVADDGEMKKTLVRPTSRGARNAVVDEHGTAYVADGTAGRILVVPTR